MSIDRLQTKIRKMKCPIILDFQLDESWIPVHILNEEKTLLKAYGRYAIELLEVLRDAVPAVRFHFSSFAVLGIDGITVLASLLDYSAKMGYYVLLDAPEALTAQQASYQAKILLDGDGQWQFDGLVLSQFIGTDAIKPYAALHNKSNKALFAIVRTGNKSGPEMQDLITGGRLVHIAQADLIHRIAEPNLGRSGFCTMGVMASATSANSLQNLREKFKYLFILIDGFDAANANAKNCGAAFNNLGHGAAVCVGSSVMAAWQTEGADLPFTESALRGVERIKKNIGRYITVL